MPSKSSKFWVLRTLKKPNAKSCFLKDLSSSHMRVGESYSYKLVTYKVSALQRARTSETAPLTLPPPTSPRFCARRLLEVTRPASVSGLSVA
jgi:hypothetical protein